MQEKCLIYIEKILKVADFFLNLVKFLLNSPILFLVDKRGCKIAQHCGLTGIYSAKLKQISPIWLNLSTKKC